MSAIRHSARKDGMPANAVEERAEYAALFITNVLGIDVIDGNELQLEEAHLKGLRLVVRPKEDA